MRKIFFAGLATFVLSGNAIAGGICENLPGHWKGSFTLKSQSDCDQYGGCTHALAADIKQVGVINFEVNLQPSKGQGAVFVMTCDNGVLNSPVNPGNTMNANCVDDHCVINYEDDRLTAYGEK